jgi:hypothetical protein
MAAILAQGLRSVSAAFCRVGAGRCGGRKVEDGPGVAEDDLNAFELSTGCSTTGQPPLATWKVEVDQMGQIILHASG